MGRERTTWRFISTRRAPLKFRSVSPFKILPGALLAGWVQMAGTPVRPFKFSPVPTTLPRTSYSPRSVERVITGYTAAPGLVQTGGEPEGRRGRRNREGGEEERGREDRGDGKGRIEETGRDWGREGIYCGNTARAKRKHRRKVEYLVSLHLVRTGLLQRQCHSRRTAAPIQ